MENIKTVSNYQKKKQDAQVYNTTKEISENLLCIGRCGYCAIDESGTGGVLAMYLKSRPENMCTYYCMNCDHKGSIKNIDKKDKFFFPMVDIVGEVSRHYDPKTFDKYYNNIPTNI